MPNWISALLGRLKGEPAHAQPWQPSQSALDTAGAPTPPTNGEAGAPGPSPAPAEWPATALSRSLQWVFGLGPPQGQPPPAPDAPNLAMLHAAVQQMSQEAQRAADWVPRVPALLPRLLKSLEQDPSQAPDLARQLNQDPALLAEVWEAARASANPLPTQGAAPAPPQSSSALDPAAAVAQLGLDGLRLAMASVAFKPTVGTDAGPFTRQGVPRVHLLGRHCANACTALAQARGADAFNAYLSGWALHAGWLVALRMADRATPLFKPDPHGLSPRHLSLQTSLPRTDGPDTPDLLDHAVIQLSLRVASRWELPSIVLGALKGLVDEDARAQWAEATALLSDAAQAARLRVLADLGWLDGPLATAALHLPDDARAWLLAPDTTPVET